MPPNMLKNQRVHTFIMLLSLQPGQIQDNPVLNELSAAVVAHRLPTTFLKRIVEARQQRLHEAAFTTVEVWAL